ncbi:Protein transport protein SEC7 [Candida viswanathii]|uniref:Protein transport protein SEC7 n=1 Tax=Candida viswanathii TaxID=5486 RepID=A0A367YFG3_9ASCO|nr:Protein transport protein SEC7 [Candida viswanathii]
MSEQEESLQSETPPAVPKEGVESNSGKEEAVHEEQPDQLENGTETLNGVDSHVPDNNDVKEKEAEGENKQSEEVNSKAEEQPEELASEDNQQQQEPPAENDSTDSPDKTETESAANNGTATANDEPAEANDEAGEEEPEPRPTDSPRAPPSTTPVPPNTTVTPAEELSVPSTPASNRNRQQSILSIGSSGTVDNAQIFKKAFENILTSKEAKKNETFKILIQQALDSLNHPESKNPQIIFNALKASCETASTDLKSKAIDLFAKLFDYAQFDNAAEQIKLTNDSVNVISACFDGEGTDPELELQVVRALMHSILLMPCHGASLLQAVRQIYNVFIFSLTPRNQAVAQGILTQVIGTIFQRVEEFMKFKSKVSSTPKLTTSSEDDDVLDATVEPNQPAGEKLTLKRLEKLNDSLTDADRENNFAGETEEDLAVKDAFLVFRAMCKLSIKSLDSTTVDMRSHSVRSKLLSLHIVHTILKEHIDIFLSHDVLLLSTNSNEQVRLINAVRQYINLALSKNAASVLAPVFEISLEIFWLVISNLRAEFKREIPVFWDEIYFPVAEMKTSSPHQKRYLLSIIERLCNDSRCIIEFYLNYDCDSSMPNICEKLFDYLTKLSLQRVEVTPQQKYAFRENRRSQISVYDINKISNLTSKTMSSKPPEPEIYSLFPLEYALKMTSIGCAVAFLRSLYSWAQRGLNNNNAHTRNSSVNAGDTNNGSYLSLRNRSDSNNTSMSASRNHSFVNGESLTADSDNPEQFESQKQRKKAFLEGVRQFNQKAKKGLSYFIANGFLESDDLKVIAKFLLETDGLDKAVIGEYLGEGGEKNIAIMHAFVDELEFDNTDFVDAMRRFLQSFRLPGEAQKIDRFMLKFAERYVLGNPGIFANADAAYILSYSVIMLNTDLHSPQIKNRMTFDSFVMNNSGIDDGKDLPREFLEKIFNEIQNNEIKLQSEQHAALLAGDIAVTPSAGQSIGFFGGRDLQREAYIHASREMATKTEKLMRNLGKKLRTENLDGVFYAATSVLHVKSIFDTLWMSVLAALTPPFKEYDEEDVTRTCLEGIKLSIRIACMFDLDYARTSFVSALVQFQNLNNYQEMKQKNVEAIHIMLDLAVSEGDHLGEGAWIQILTSISQLERLQLIAQGVDQDSIPDVTIAKLVTRNSVDTTRTSSSFFSFSSSQTPAQSAASKFHNQHLSPEVASMLTKTELEVAIDKVFTNSANLSGESIVEFVKALSEIAQEEIDSSGQSTNPRTYSLLKVVDICYYNMNRIRLEWSHLWATMGETFNAVGCHTNPAILFFALDSLRQLSMRFFEIDELAHFKFQKEFLKPFEYIIIHNDSLEVKDMVLECINNMILARASQIKSGWKTIFGVCTAAAKENKESLVMKSYKMANWINKEYVEEVRQQESFSDLVVCFTVLAKNEKFQRISLLSLDVLSRLIHEIAQYTVLNGAHDSNGKSKSNDPENNEFLVKLWFPVLFGFHDIIMTGEELEVRSRALTYLFDVLMKYGEYFDLEFWDVICQNLLFPIFSVLSNHWEIGLDDLNDKLSVWLSTTLIQALKSMITLFTHYFDALSRMLDGYLELIISCICQENDTIARIGRECLTALLTDNAQSFSNEHWAKISDALANLFELTTAKELFTSDPLRSKQADESFGDMANEDSQNGNGEDIEANESKNSIIDDAEERLKKSKEKSSIVVKSVLQLLLIQSLSELFENDDFYEGVPYDYLMKMSDLLNSSYNFAKKFNDDYDLRVRLWNAGVIERLPNLLKQESSSAAVFINIMFRMYCDDGKVSPANKQTLINKVVPLCNTILKRYSELDETNQQRNISTWKPVIVEIYEGYVELDDEDFRKHAPSLYNLTLRLFSKSISGDLRMALKAFLTRVGEEFVTTTSN